MDGSGLQKAPVDNVISKDKLLGEAKRWRRFGAPVPAGRSTNADGSPDYGIFGPGSMAWEVLLHPATIVLETIGQSTMQLLYKPIAAGIRDHDPISRKARAGTLTYFDGFERFQRNAGMHAPMWLGDTDTAKRMAEHLNHIHQRVASDVIDFGDPGLGGYGASEPRELLWAGLTEMHPLLWMYEAFAFRNGLPPRRLSRAKRDQYIKECGAYLRLVGAKEHEIPVSMAQLGQLYRKHAALFGTSASMDIIPETGQSFHELSSSTMKQNFHKSQLLAIIPLAVQFRLLKMPIMGAMSAKTRRAAGFGPFKSALAVAAKFVSLPLFWVLQQRPVERRLMRLMWGPDGVALVESARQLHKQARKRTTAKG